MILKENSQNMIVKAIKFIKLNMLFQPLLIFLSLLSSIFVIRQLGTEIYGLYAISLAMILNTLIYGGIGVIYVSRKYEMIHIPFDFLKVLVVSMIITLAIGYFVENYILSLIFNVGLFLTLFYFLYKVKEEEKKLLKDFIPHKIYRFLPSKYRIDR